MIIYTTIAVCIFILRYALGNYVELSRQLYYLIISFLFIFSAFRYQVGCDWSGYYSQYLRASNLTWDVILENRESIWWGFLKWIREMGLPYPFLNILSSALFFFGVHILARRQPDPLGFLVLLFPILIINMPMSGIRQGAAIGLLCIAFVAFIDRRPLWFAFWVVVGSEFHSSALIFLLLLPVATGRYTKGRLMLAALLAVPGAFFLASGDAAELATNRYIGTEIDAAGAVFRVGILGLSALYFFLILRKKWQLTWPQDYSIVIIGAVGMALSVFLLPISTVIGDRLGYYFIPLQALIFARIPFLPFRANAAFYSALPYFGLLLVFIVWSQNSWHFQRCYIPYQSWFFGFSGGDKFGF